MYLILINIDVVKILMYKFVIFICLSGYVHNYKLPTSCDVGQFYEPNLMDCLACPANASLVRSADGFGCACEDHSIPVGIARCKPCNITDVISSDGTKCVPRRCQSSAGRIVCRKCPNDYISVTQNFDGSPMKEVQCVKCARGYKAFDNRCVRCEACSCNKLEIVVKGRCIPKKYLLDRPKYIENHLHPNDLLEIVKLEYFCTQRDYRACRALGSACVRNFYTTHAAGPCRLWIQSDLVKFKGLPILTVNDAETSFERRNEIIKIAMAIHTKSGGLKILQDSNKQIECLPPIYIKTGVDVLRDCSINATVLSDTDFGAIFELYLKSEKTFKPLPILLRKPNGYDVQKSTWPSKHFRKFFLINSFLSTTTNKSDTVYLRTLVIRVSLKRNSSAAGLLSGQLNVEGHYSTMSPLTDIFTTTLRVEHDLPDARVLRGLEICGGVLGMLAVLHALVRGRGVVTRGELWIALIPMLASSVADALYFATLFSSLHALAAEAGTLALTLPLSKIEENVIEGVIYTSIGLKALKVLCTNWSQCRCDIFFVDWSKYNPPTKDISIVSKSNNWKEAILAREWTSLQTLRRVSPGFTATSTLLILYLLKLWQSNLPSSQGYTWVIASVTWWCSYIIMFSVRFFIDKLIESPSRKLMKICSDLELSLLVFEHEYYAHYIDGRSEDLMDFRPSTHALQTCRIVCSRPLRNVYKKLTTNGMADQNSNRALLSQLLSAFFERALDGLSWVASERTIMEKLMNVEFVVREGSNTSVLLYDNDTNKPSCLDVTWWGEEWMMATFDSMLFGCILVMTENSMLAALITLIVWQAMKSARILFGSYNLNNKIDLRN